MQLITVGPIEDRYVFDTALGLECRAAVGGRCRPRSTFEWDRAYGDAVCTTPVIVALVASRPCDPAVRFASYGAKTYAITTPATDVYSTTPGVGCAPYLAPQGRTAYVLGEPLPDEMFVASAQVVDR